MIVDWDADIKGTFVPITEQDRHRLGGWHDTITPTEVSDDIRALILAEIARNRDTDRGVVREALRELEGVDVTVEQIAAVFDEVGFCDCHAGCEGCICSPDCKFCERRA